MTESLQFTLRAQVDDQEVTPASIPLTLFTQFNDQVQAFIFGGAKPRKQENIRVSVESGSYRLRVELDSERLERIEKDLQVLQTGDKAGVNPRRIEVLGKWEAASKAEGLVYEIGSSRLPRSISIDRETRFYDSSQRFWVTTEKFLHGTVLDLGGTKKVNLHLCLKDSGKTLIINTDAEYLRRQEENHLYKERIVQVRGEEHLVTGELRNLWLLQIRPVRRKANEAALRERIALGTESWKDIPDANTWLEDLRGYGNG
ncbi:MAG: Uncharacterized protein E1N59_2944 [Puniceicoccaceae bacterium 5H]|nr:MAG: Uncharacterized protein E1N59_2944 [Puniceicoccaceae bacterium 5H]